MPSGREIRAGKAYVELGVKDKLLSGFKSALKGVAGFATSVIGVTAGIGAAALTAAGIAAKAFADMGSELNDASARTGVAVEQLSAYKHAAEQTSSSLEGFEGRLKKMQKTIAAAADGSTEAGKALYDVGLSVQDLKDLSPDKQFDKISAAVAKVKDPTQRAAAAMKIFGKSATELLPMMQDLAALKKEATDAGIIVSSEDAKNADDFGDALHLVWEQGKMVVFHLGAAVAKGLMPYKRSIVQAMKTAIDWVRNSRQTIAHITSAFAAGLGWIIDRLKDVGRIANDTFGGALDALASGDWKLAGELAVGNLKIAWLGLKDWFNQLFQDIGDSLVSAQIQAIAKVQELWARAQNFLKKIAVNTGDSAIIGDIKSQIEVLEDRIKSKKEHGEDTSKQEKTLKDLKQQVLDAQNIHEAGLHETDAETDEKLAAIAKERDAQLGALNQIHQKQANLDQQKLGEGVLGVQKQLNESKLANSAMKALDFLFGGVQTDPSNLKPPKFGTDEEVIGSASKSMQAASGAFNPFAAAAIGGNDVAAIAKSTNETAKNTSRLVTAVSGGIRFTYQP